MCFNIRMTTAARGNTKRDGERILRELVTVSFGQHPAADCQLLRRHLSATSIWQAVANPVVEGGLAAVFDMHTQSRRAVNCYVLIGP